MLDNITALNINEELINNKVVKAGVGKYSKPAKLSSGKTFKAKTKEVMSKINNPVNSVPEAAPSVEPAQAQTVAEPTPPTPPVATIEVNATPEAKVTETPAIELPTIEQATQKAKIVNISVVNLSNEENIKNATPSRKLRVSGTVVTRTGNILKVLLSVPEPVAEELPEQANEEVQVAPTVAVANEKPAEEAAPQEETETQEATEQPNFFLGQKLNTKEITEEEPKAETPLETKEEEEKETQSEETSGVTQEEKENKLNQYLNGNQEAVQGKDGIDDLNLENVLQVLDDYKKASEQISDRQTEINKLNKDLADAKKMLTEKNKEILQMLKEAKEKLEKQNDEINSKTFELSNLRAAIIGCGELKERPQNIVQDEEEEMSLGKVA